MRECSPEQFQTRWPDALRPLQLPQALELSTHCRHLLIDFGVPVSVTIECYNDTTITFTGTATPLASIWARELSLGYKLGEMPGEWTRYWHLADESATQFEAWICIDQETECLVVIDLNNDNQPVYLLSSSVSDFYTILGFFLEWSETAEHSLDDVAALRDHLLNQECIPLDQLEPFWLNFVYANLDYHDGRLCVKLNQRAA